MKDSKLDQIVNLITDTIVCDSIVLFGSRARGDFNDRSDYDIAVKGISELGYAKALDAIENNQITLLKIDFLRYDDLPESYKNSVDQEGVVLYEKPRFG